MSLTSCGLPPVGTRPAWVVLCNRSEAQLDLPRGVLYGMM
jgi:hypothetical protein